MRNSRKSKILGYLIVVLTLTQIMNSYAEDFTLRGVLGDNSLFTLLHHKKAQTSRLEIVSAVDSRETALITQDRIAGYPIIGKLNDLDQNRSIQLVEILLNEENYSDLRQRCINRTLNGVRFSLDNDKVEVAIGRPCNQVFVAFKHENETKLWGSTLGDTATKKALKLLCSAKTE